MNKPLLSSIGLHLFALAAFTSLNARSLSSWFARAPRDTSPFQIELTRLSARADAPSSMRPPRFENRRVIRARRAQLKSLARTMPPSQAPSPAQSAGTLAPSPAREGAALPQGAPSFAEELRQALERCKDYPPLARARRQSGRVQVGFTLQKSGRIVNARVVGPCDYATLNQAALQTVNKLGVFKPVPDSVSRADWQVVVPIDFRIGS